MTTATQYCNLQNSQIRIRIQNAVVDVILAVSPMSFILSNLWDIFT